MKLRPFNRVKRYCLFAVWGYAQLCLGQTTTLDSLRNKIKASEKDTTRIFLYYAYGTEMENAQPDSALYYFDLAKALSTTLNYDRGKASYSSHAITILNAKGKFREALGIAQDALRLYETMGNQRDLAVAYLNVGSEWHYLSDFQMATEYYLKSKKIAETIGDKRLQRITNNNLASIFINLKEYRKGKQYAEASLQIARELNNEYAISSSMFNIATAELYLKQYDDALKNYTAIEEMGLQTDDYILILDGQLGSADVFSATKNTTKALKYYTKVISLSQEKEAPEYEMYAYMGLSDLYLNNEDYTNAKNNIEKGIALAKQLESQFEMKDLVLKAAELAEKTGKYKEALNYRKQYEVLNDSIVGEKSKSNINLLEAKFEADKKESLITQLEAEKQIQQLQLQQKSLWNYILLGATLAILLLSLLLYRNYIHKQRLQQQRITDLEREKHLTAAEAVLKGEEQERTRLAKDLHDGLGGMLSGIKYSFQTMKENLIMTPENLQSFERSMDMLDSSIKEMRRVAHNMMPESLVKFGLDTALRDFCTEIGQSGALQINYQSIGLNQDNLEKTAAIAVYRIVQELIGNILKHASAKTALVQVAKNELHLTITVEDDGKGFDTTMLQTSKGIGWTNIQNRVDFLKGSLTIDSQPEKGTSVHIEFEV